MKTPQRRKRPAPKAPSWVIVRRGFVQHYGHEKDGKSVVALPLFSSRDTAMAFIRGFMNTPRRDAAPTGSRLSPAEIGTVEGETLETVLDGAAETGANQAWWVHKVRENGFDYSPLDLWEAAQ